MCQTLSRSRYVILHCCTSGLNGNFHLGLLYKQRQRDFLFSSFLFLQLSSDGVVVQVAAVAFFENGAVHQSTKEERSTTSQETTELLENFVMHECTLGPVLDLPRPVCSRKTHFGLGKPPRSSVKCL